MKTVENIKGLVKEGNTCLFLLFVLFNFFILLSSLGILGCDVYLFVITKEANTFNISFLVIGLVLLFFSILAFYMRKSVHLLGFYLVILSVVFLFELIITIIMIVKKDALLELAQKYMDDSDKSLEEIKKWQEQMDQNILSCSLALVAFSCIVVSYNTLKSYLYSTSLDGC